MLVSLIFTCQEVSVPPWQPFLTMAGPSILPLGAPWPLPTGPGSARQHALGMWVLRTESAFVQSVGSSC